MEVLVCIHQESFQHTLSDHKALQTVGAREANYAHAGITLGHSSDVWRHDVLTCNLPSSLFLGASLRQNFHFLLDCRYKNIASPSIVTDVSLLCHLLYQLLSCIATYGGWRFGVAGFFGSYLYDAAFCDIHEEGT